MSRLGNLIFVTFDRWRLGQIGRLILLAGAVGVVSGVGAFVFNTLSQFVLTWTLERFAGYEQGGAANEPTLWHVPARDLVPWLLVLVPAIGGLVSGWIVYTFAPEAEGHGTDAAIDAYHNKRGVIRGRVPLVKIITAAITIGTGGSGGREGPIAQIGAGFGSFLGGWLKLSDAQRRVLLASGMGAGVGAIFHAPLAGAIFAVEVLYREPDFETEALIPAFIATTVAYSVFGLIYQLFGSDLVFQPLFRVPVIAHPSPLLLLPLAALALVVVLGSYAYVRGFYGITGLFRRLPVPRKLRPAIGAALTGLVGLTLYEAFDTRAALSVMSFGYGILQTALAAPGSLLGSAQSVQGAVLLLLAIAFGKILTTSLTIGSGGSGGVFGPSMVIGGCLGGVVGLLFAQLWPDLVDPRVFVILGMAGFFAAAANTPVSTLIMVSEMTASYVLLFDSMWVCALAYLLARGWSIYKEQVRSRLDSPVHRGDFIVDVLEGLRVREALRADGDPTVKVPLDMALNDVVHLIADTRQSVFPVVDADGHLRGIFSVNDIRQFLYDPTVGEVAIAQDLARGDIQPLGLDASLSLAMERFGRIGYEELPVVDPDDQRKVVGILRQRDVIAAYNARLISVRRQAE